MSKRIISCDWGTTNFRLRLLDVTELRVLEQYSSGEGIAMTHDEWRQSGLLEHQRLNFYKQKLLKKINGLQSEQVAGLPVFISGMASSSLGMMEIPYSRIPFPLDGRLVEYHNSICSNEEGGYELFLISGVATPTDVMRGEETMLLGLEDAMNARGLYLFPGTHSKHVSVNHGIVNGFNTFMTGEIFDLLKTRSVLATAVSSPAEEEADWASFSLGVQEAQTGNLLERAFQVRSRQLLQHGNPEKNYQYLSGLLIGTELKSIAAEEFITVVATAAFQQRYRAALTCLLPSREIRFLDADDCFTRGHLALARQLC